MEEKLRWLGRRRDVGVLVLAAGCTGYVQGASVSSARCFRPWCHANKVVLDRLLVAALARLR